MIQLPNATSRFVEARGLRFHVAEAGDGPPLVLLHGWPQDGRMWRHCLPGLAQEFRCIVPDLRGLGRSDAPPTGYAKQELADDVLALLDVLGLDRVRMIGHDWGAFVTQLIALGAPERLEKALVLDVPPLWVRGYDPRQLLGGAHMPILSSPFAELLVPRVADTVLRMSKLTPDSRESYLTMLREPARRRASVGYYRTFLLTELPKLLASSRERPDVPVRFIGGAGDPVVRYAPEVELVPGSGHFLPEEQPDVVVERALRFL